MIQCIMAGEKLSAGHSTEAEKNTHDECQIASPVSNQLGNKGLRWLDREFHVLLGSPLLGVDHQGCTELGCGFRGTQRSARRDGAFMPIEAQRCALRG